MNQTTTKISRGVSCTLLLSTFFLSSLFPDYSMAAETTAADTITVTTDTSAVVTEPLPGPPEVTPLLPGDIAPVDAPASPPPASGSDAGGTEGKITDPEATDSMTSMAAMDSGGTGDGMSQGAGTIPGVAVGSPGNSGSLNMSLPIEVPPGRAGMMPHLALTYNSSNVNGWLGVGWDLEVGAIQRATKRGVNYGADDYVLLMGGRVSELIRRTDWGENCFGSKTESAFTVTTDEVWTHPPTINGPI